MGREWVREWVSFWNVGTSKKPIKHQLLLVLWAPPLGASWGDVGTGWGQGSPFQNKPCLGVWGRTSYIIYRAQYPMKTWSPSFKNC